MSLLAVEDLTVRYGPVTALAGVSLRVEAGEAVALLGANGAGKSTLMQAIVGLLSPSAGQLSFAGERLGPAAVHRRARLGIGYAPEGRRVFPGMTVRENLEVASFRAGPARARLIDGVEALFPALREKTTALAWQLSGGQQQMLAIGRALMTEPRLLLLDEPSLGLSPLLTREVLDRVRDIVGQGTAVLLAEQNVARALAITDRAYVLQVGRLVETGRSADLADSPAIRAAFLGA
jgi:branched-chain amino acid transport system ATP-binding protein